MMKPRIIVTRRVPPAVLDRMKTEFDSVLTDTDMTQDEAVAAAVSHEADALFLSHRFKLNAATIARLPDHVRIGASCAVGFDNIDVAAAQARGLVVTNSPEVLTDCTADMAFLLILAACRRAKEYGQIMREGWRRGFGMDELVGVKISGKTLGIVGMGRIGQAVAQRARGFGMKILYSDIRELPPELAHGAQRFADFRDMLPHCDIVTLHAPSGPETEKMMNAETFALLPKGAVFVNGARGQLVDEDALMDALRSGHLFAAGLDVFRKEPDFDLRLNEFPNLFLTPHMGSGTMETRTAMGMRALDNIAAVCSGRAPIDPLWR
jgi:lactate dehydrogenase-like 2-hydroxyacid dehydrogenase